MIAKLAHCFLLGLGCADVAVEPVRKGLDVFMSLPKIGPTVPFAWANDNVDCRSANFFGFRPKTLGLLQGYNHVRIAVDNQYWRQSRGDVVNWGYLPSEDLPTDP